MDVEVVVLTGQTCLAFELPTLIIIHYGFAEQVLQSELVSTHRDLCRALTVKFRCASWAMSSVSWRPKTTEMRTPLIPDNRAGAAALLAGGEVIGRLAEDSNPKVCK